MKLKTKAVVPWYGSNRMLAKHVGEAFQGCTWVGIPFAGGMCEVPYFDTARTIVANDLHRHLINLAVVISNTESCEDLTGCLDRMLFHADLLRHSQSVLRRIEDGESEFPQVEWAYHFFVCCWMTRSGDAGTSSEFSGKISTRWEASGGDSAVRFRHAVESIDGWREIFQRKNCTFLTMDAFDFLDKCKDRPETGIYLDPPFPGAGARYRHAPKDEGAWHERLRDRLLQFERSRVVFRYHAHPLIERLYLFPDSPWQVTKLTGRAQSNGLREEWLIRLN